MADNPFQQHEPFDLLEESILYDRLVPGRINRTDVLLPRGNPSGHNVLLTIICKDIQTTLDRIKGGKSLRIPAQYRYFIKPPIVVKTAFNRRQRIVTERAALREFAKKNKLIWISSPTSDLNAIADISSEMKAYLDIAQTRPMSMVSETFIPYLKTCIYQMPKTDKQRNIIVIDAVDYLFSRATPAQSMKGNPLFLLYKTVRDNPTVLIDNTIEFVFMGLNNSIYYDPKTLTDPKALRQFFNNLFLFMNTNVKQVEALEKKLQKEEEKQKEITPVAKPIVQKPDDKVAALAIDTRNQVAGIQSVKPDIYQPTEHKPAELQSTTTNDLPPLPHNELKVMISDDTEDDPPPKTDLFDDMLDDGDRNDAEEQQSSDEDDELFVPFSDEDPFGEIAKADRRPKQARVRSKVIEPGSERQKELLEEQAKINVRNRTVEQEQKILPGNIAVPETTHEHSVATHNEEVKTSRYENYRKTYMTEAFDSDMVKAFTSLNFKENAFYIKDIKITDNSDSMNYLERWDVTFIDQYGVQSTVKLDIPKIYDNKYFYLGGNLKTLENQNVPLPIIKTGPNRVIITTNYNKIFMERYDTKSMTTISRLTKVISYDLDHEYFITGNSRVDNSQFDIPLAMSEIGNRIVRFRGKNARLYFNMKLPIMVKNNADAPADKVWIGKVNGKDIWIGKTTGKTDDGKSIIDLILENLPEEYLKVYNSVKTPKVNMYARMKMNMKNVPCLYILSYWAGLGAIIEKADIQYRFVNDDSGRSKKNPKEIMVPFEDGCLYYEATEVSELLLNPLLNLNTRDMNWHDMDTPETWEPILVNIYGSYRALNVIKAFREWMIDWITLEILQMYKLPETIEGLIIYGIKLLADNKFTPEINDSVQRMRHMEVIPAMVYYRLANQYARYSSTGGRSKMTLPQDAIVKDLLALTTLEDTSVLNPALELSKDSSISKRGFRGTNLDAAYTRALRTYSDDSIGKHATSTATSTNVGIQKYLTHEPDIMNIRGIRENAKSVDEMEGVNVMSTVEMLIPMTVQHDDAPRIAMGIKQAGHVVPTEVSAPALISNGVEEAIRFRLSSEYVVNAEADGKVVEYDEKSGMMVVQYKPYDAKPGKFRAVKLSPDVVKNSGGGFYFSKQMVSPLKVGDTFKKDDVIAYHSQFFSYSKLNGLCYNIGPLVRVVLHATSEAYEDGGWLTEDAAEMMATSVVYKEDSQLDRNATISKIAKIGDVVHIDDKLISFASGSEDAQLNKLLAELDDDTSESLQQGKRADHAGEIIDIVIYSQVDPEECSPSVKKLLTEYRTRVQRIGKVLDKYDKTDGIVKAGYMNRTPETNVKNQYGKIKGVETDILIEFYIKHNYNLSIGDKIVLYSANKNTLSKVVPNEQAGWSEKNPDDPIMGAISPSPLSKRIISSPEIVLANTTCMIELKRKVLDIWKNG